MNKKRVLLGLILVISMMLSGCFWWPGGYVVNDHPHRGYYQHHDQHDDHSYQQGSRGHRR